MFHKQQESDSAAETRGGRARLLEWAALALIAVLYVGHVVRYDFVSDDAFITFRYARNLAAGLGLVFNAGERVEGFSSPLWTILLAGVRAAGADIALSARVLGVAFGLLALVACWRLALATGVTGRYRPASLLAPLLLAANGSFACWAASGMETPLYVLLILTGLLSALSLSLPAMALSVVGLVFVRPEGSALILLLVLHQALRRHEIGRKPLLVTALAGAASLILLFGLRYSYYGDWLPNTYYAKTGGGLAALSQGFTYLSDYAADHEGFILLCVPVLAGLLSKSATRRTIALAALGLWVVTVAEGGDGLPMYRFALPAVPLLAVLDAVLLVDLLQLLLRSAVVSARTAGIVMGTATALLALVHFTPPACGTHYGLYEDQVKIEIPRWALVGHWLAEHADKDASIAAGPIGAVSYYSGLKTLDMMGLTDRHIARSAAPRIGRGWVGHEKHDAAYILGLRPTYLLLGNIDVTDQPRDPSARPFIEYQSGAVWQRERDMYKTDIVWTAYEPRSVEIAPGQFLNFYQLRAR